MDTDTFTLWLSGHPEVCSRIASTEDDRLAVTIITVEEVLSGWYTQLRKSKDDARLARAYRSLQDSVEVFGLLAILPFDAAAIARYRNLSSLHRRTGRNDLKIAATVLEHADTLVTRNVTDFESVDGLTIEDWSRSGS